METNFCVEALVEAIERYGQPEILNTDQGVQFTSAAFVDEFADRGVRISMDGKGRYLDCPGTNKMVIPILIVALHCLAPIRYAWPQPA